MFSSSIGGGKGTMPGIVCWRLVFKHFPVCVFVFVRGGKGDNAGHRLLAVGFLTFSCMCFRLR